MMKIFVQMTSLIIVLCGDLFSQSVPGAEAKKNKALQDLAAMLDENQLRCYHVTRLFKEFGVDTFSKDEFDVIYRTSDLSPLYGYDYQIAEVRNQDTFITMALKDSFYTIFSGNRKMAVRKLPDEIDLGNYFENIRSSYIIHDVLQPFVTAPSNQISVSDSNGLIYFHREMNTWASKALGIDAETQLPVKWASVIESPDFDLTQTMEVHFEFPQTVPALHLESLIQHYLATGYELLTHTPGTSGAVSVDRQMSLEQHRILWNYPFILATGDTVYIRDNKSEYILIDFWFASCLPCLKALPELNTLARSYSDKGLAVLAINCFDQRIMENLVNKSAQENIDIPLLFGSESLIDSLDITSFPRYYLVTPDQHIEILTGGMPGVKQTLSSLFDRN